MIAEEGKIKNSHRLQIKIAMQGNRNVVIPGRSRRWKPFADLGKSLGCSGKIRRQMAAQMSSSVEEEMARVREVAKGTLMYL